MDEQNTIWRPRVEPTQNPLPHPGSSAPQQGQNSRTQSHHYTKTSLAHHYQDATSGPASHLLASSRSTRDMRRELNRQILSASQSYNSSPKPFVRQASLREPSELDRAQATTRQSQPLPYATGNHQHQVSPLPQHQQDRAKLDSMSPKLVHQQYNSPVNLYSMNNIRKTIEAHSELLAPGVKGINFMKADAPVNKQSEVLKLIKEEEEERRSRQSQQKSAFSGEQSAGHYVQYAAEQSSLNSNQSRPVLKQQQQPYSNGGRAASIERHMPADTSVLDSRGAPKCFECGQAIVGPFARIQDRCIHAHCFNCSTCGTSLKNSGYFTINDKLYCEIHARQVANVMRLNYNFEPNKQAVVSIQNETSEQRREERTQQFQIVKQTANELQQRQQSNQQVQVKAHMPGPPPPPPVITVASSGGGAHCSHCCAGMRNQSGGATTISTMFSGTTGGSHCQHCNNHCSCQRRSEIRWTWRPASHVEHVNHQQHHESAAVSSMTSSRTLEQRNKYESRLQAHSLSSDANDQRRATTSATCCHCRVQIYGPYVLAGNSTWCKSCSQTNFVCHSCHRSLLNIGFIEDSQTGQFNCENCYETLLAPVCSKCHARIRGDCLNALGKQWHPNCFVCGHCRGPFGNTAFYLEDNVPYCERDWNLLFTTKCYSCGHPIEAGDKWIEALDRNYHSDCFRCTGCQVKLEGSTFYCKGGKPYCQMHAR